MKLVFPTCSVGIVDYLWLRRSPYRDLAVSMMDYYTLHRRTVPWSSGKGKGYLENVVGNSDDGWEAHQMILLSLVTPARQTQVFIAFFAEICSALIDSQSSVLGRGHVDVRLYISAF